MNVSVFPDIKKVTRPPAKVNVDKVLERIRTGENGLKELIERIRVGDGNREALKKELGAIIFAGYCGNGIEKVNRATGNKYLSYRDDPSLTEHSGLCVIDLDHLTELDKWKKHFMTDEHVYSVFVSPSGDGLKVIYRIPADIDMHRAYYRAILDDLQGLGLKVDSTSVNESRVCFISYDANIHINKQATPYEKFMVENESDADDGAIKKGTGLTDFEKMSIAAKMIDGARDGHKHRTLIKASYLMGGYIASKFVREDDARKMLRDRIKAKSPSDLEMAYNTIEDGLQEGKHKPIYEIEQIEKEFKVQLLRDKYESEDRGFTFLIDRNETDRKMMDIIVNGVQQGLPIGIPELDKHFRLKENNFSVFLGHDNVGKSTLVWWLSAVASAKHGWKWLIYSPENKIEKIKINLMDYVLGKSVKECSQAQLQLARKFIDEHFYFIRKDKMYSIYDVLEFGRVMIDKDPAIKGFMIDPYNSLMMDYKEYGQGLSGYEYHMKAISAIRIFSETHCSVYVNAHSVTESRRMKIDDNGDIPRPFKAHIDGGAMWGNRCDDFFVIHRQVKNPETWMITQLHVDKVKDTDEGGEVTRGEDEAVELQFWHKADFVDPETRKSPLAEWRLKFFKVGTQKTMVLDDLPSGDTMTGDLPLGDPNTAF
jgi:energy-coupling factor transporter ATP-binding protein EcfA2